MGILQELALSWAILIATYPVAFLLGFAAGRWDRGR